MKTYSAYDDLVFVHIPEEFSDWLANAKPFDDLMEKGGPIENTREIWQKKYSVEYSPCHQVTTVRRKPRYYEQCLEQAFLSYVKNRT